MSETSQRLIELAARHTGLSPARIEEHLIYLNRLPVGEIEHKLADYYDEAAHVMVLYVSVLRHIRDLTQRGVPLDDPVAHDVLHHEEIRLRRLSRKLEETEKKVDVFAEELAEKAGVLPSVRLAHVDRKDDGLFLLRFRRVNPGSPTGLDKDDSVLIFADTTPGHEGAQAYVHQVAIKEQVGS